MPKKKPLKSTAKTRYKELRDAGYEPQLAKAIAKYPASRWTDVRLFQEKRRKEVCGK